MPRRFALPARRRLPRPLRWTATVAVCALVTVMALSGVRAWVQVYDLDLRLPGDTLRSGATIDAPVTTSGRTWVDVRIELVQNGRIETLGMRRVDSNGEAKIDFRPHRDRLTLTVAPSTLRGFAPGPAVLRATAVGRSQFLRTPPPTIRERPVVIPQP